MTHFGVHKSAFCLLRHVAECVLAQFRVRSPNKTVTNQMRAVNDVKTKARKI